MEQSNDIKKNLLPIKFLCEEYKDIEKKTFYYEPNLTVSEMLSRFKYETRIEKECEGELGSDLIFIYKGIVLYNDHTPLKDKFKNDDSIQIIIQVHYRVG